MAFSNTMAHMIKLEGGDVEIGTFTNDTTAGGTVQLRLKTCTMFLIQPMNSSVNATESSVNESFPCDASVIVVTPSDSLTYLYMAFGGQ